jgi:hypothetical protein
VFGLYISLAVLGLAAVDPVGIGAMPVLLAQQQPYKRVLLFLGGSFVSLVVMGLLFAKGLGAPVLRFQHDHAWLLPAIEVFAGVALWAIAVVAYARRRAGKGTSELSPRTRQWLQFRGAPLFALGALLVAIQSVVDVVFVVAMIRVGQYHVSAAELLGATADYALAALLLQIAVVFAFRWAPARRKARVLHAVRSFLVAHGDQALIVAGVLLGVVLFGLAIFSHSGTDTIR